MTGNHRKPTPFVITLRATIGVVAGAAVLGTAGVAAQAAVVSPSKTATATAAAAAAEMPARAGHSPSAEGERSKTRKSKAPADRPAAKKPTAEEAVKLARSQVGIEENGSGNTKFHDWYMSTDRAKETVARDGGSVGGYSGAQWCDMFVSWVGDRLGFRDQMGDDAWTVAHAEWFKEQDRWGTEPRPGAIVFFSWSGGRSTEDIVHVGMVIKDNGDGTVQTVEGNTSNAVRVRERDASSVVGYGYPEYAK